MKKQITKYFNMNTSLNSNINFNPCRSRIKKMFQSLRKFSIHFNTDIFSKNSKFFVFLISLFIVVFVGTNQWLNANPGSAKMTEDIKGLEKIQPYQPVISNMKQLTFSGPRSGEGYFNKDGTKIVFQSERPQFLNKENPFYQIYLMDLKTGQTDLISNGDGQTTCSWIHPSGKKILFSSTHQDPHFQEKQKQEFEIRKSPNKQKYSWSFDENYEIYEAKLSANKNNKNKFEYKALTHSVGYDAEGSYSSDGKKIVFASNRNAYDPKFIEQLSEEDKKYLAMDPSYLMDIYTMNADGSDVRQLTNVKGYDGGPFFSADGKKITWRRFSANGQSAEIYTMNSDGTDQKPVTQLSVMSWAPFYHPSGDYIIFTSNLFGYGNFELFIVDSLGLKKPVRVTQLDGFDGLPTFTPDGKKISWTRRNEKGESQIFIADWNHQLAKEALGLSVAAPQLTGLSSDIKTEDIQEWVQYLSSFHLAGRQSGSKMEDEYMNQLQKAFASWGFKGWNNQFLQNFDFISGVQLGSKNQMEIFLNQKSIPLEISKDFLPLSFSQIQYQLPKSSPVVFVGYGMDITANDKFSAYNSYQGLDVNNKWVLIFKDIPEDIPNEKRIYFNMFSRLQHKVLVAKNKGAAGVIFIKNKTDSKLNLNFQGAVSNNVSVSATNDVDLKTNPSETVSSSLPVVEITFDQAKNWFLTSNIQIETLKSSWDKGEIIFPEWVGRLEKLQVDLSIQTQSANNIVAVLPGPNYGKKNDSIVFIGAHGDHLGRGEFGSSLAKDFERQQIHPGADDNASGVAGVMELAHYFSKIKKNDPKKIPVTLVFAVWSAEEIGVIGSSKFLKSTSTEIKNNIKAYINMDMIGRLKDYLQIQGVGSSKEWTGLIESILVNQNLSVKLTEDPYLPTDSMSFYMAKIPTISLFTGAHEDYHSPRDLASRINYSGEEKILSLTKNIIKSAMTKNLPYELVSSQKNQLEGRRFRIFLGTIPDYSQEGVKGVRISGASKDSPAAVAGLQANDIIVELNQQKIENLYDYVYALQLLKANKETIIKIKRPQNSGVDLFLDLKITPALKE